MKRVAIYSLSIGFEMFGPKIRLRKVFHKSPGIWPWNGICCKKQSRAAHNELSTKWGNIFSQYQPAAPPQDAKNYLVKSADMECLWILSFFTHLSPTCTIVLCRTNGRVLDVLCQEIGYTPHLFEATDKHGDISPPFHLFDRLAY